MAAAAGGVQAGQQYHVHETFIGGEEFDALITFSSTFDEITAVAGTLINPWTATTSAVDGFWSNSYISYAPGTRGVALTGPDGWPDGYLLDFSWHHSPGPNVSLPVFVTQSWYDDATGWNYWYNNSINGSNYATSVTITAVPEPAEYALLSGGLAVLGYAFRRRKQDQAC